MTNIAHDPACGSVDPFVKPAADKARAICILGMHRSGTSTIARAINLLGVYLGDEAKMMPSTPDNAEGYWEHLEIHDLHKRLLARLERGWDANGPLPAGWNQSEIILPFKQELSGIVAADFGRHPLWAWKEPQTSLLLPLWREILEKADTKLSCLFFVRSPVDVANSLMRRDGIPFDRAVGIWFHYNLVALQDALALPVVFASYDRLLAEWEPEMRRCAAALELGWPQDEARYRETMNAFIKPGLRHNQSSADQLQQLPDPVRELYQILLEASLQPSLYDGRHAAAIQRLFREFQAYASLLAAPPQPPTYEQPLETTVNRLSNDLDAYISHFPHAANPPRRELVIAWRARNSLQFRYLGVQTQHQLSPRIQQLLGDKLCRSLCKRLAKACCWFHP